MIRANSRNRLQSNQNFNSLKVYQPQRQPLRKLSQNIPIFQSQRNFGKIKSNYNHSISIAKKVEQRKYYQTQRENKIKPKCFQSTFVQLENSGTQFKVSRTFPKKRKPSIHLIEVQDYVQDITNYIIQNQSSTLIAQDYMPWHTDINLKMREILIDWIILVHHRFQLKQNTLHLAVSLLDRFCYSRFITRPKYQLLGVACLFISAKFQQIDTPRLMKYVLVCDNAYSSNDLLAMESQILLTLNFKIQGVLSHWLIQNRLTQINQGDQNLEKNINTRQYYFQQVSFFILNQTLIEYQFCSLRPNYITSVIIYFSNKILNSHIDDSKMMDQNSIGQDSKENYKKQKQMQIQGDFQIKTEEYNKIVLKSSQIINQYQLDKQTFKIYFKKISKLWNNRKDDKFRSVRDKYKRLFDENFDLRIRL